MSSRKPVKAHVHHLLTKNHLWLLLGGLLFVVELVFQLMYPYDTALPFASSNGQSAAYKPYATLATEFQSQFEQAKVKLSSNARSTTMVLSKIGATLNADRMSRTLTSYPLWQRLIPFSILVLHPAVESLDVSMSGPQVASQLDALAASLTAPPVDAAILLTGGKLNIVAAKDGTVATARDVRTALLGTTYRFGMTEVIVGTKVVPPARGDGDIATVKAQASAALTKQIAITIEDKGEFMPDVAAKASWLSLPVENGVTKLAANLDAIKTYVTLINDKVRANPTNTVVTIVDGNETSRTEGANGSALAIDSVADAVSQTLLDAAKPVTVRARLEPIAPTVVYSRSYSHSQAGLQAYVSSVTTSPGIHIVVQQLNGEGWSASGRADESIPSASTYKLFVVKMLFKKMDEGTVHWDDPILDTTVSGCFDRMTIASTNPCAVEWLDQFGRGTMNEYVSSLGFTGTSFTNPLAVHTSASDLAKYMIGLENGSLISGAYRDRLYHSLGTHPYRYGIPTGVKGAVYDKVGFLWDYVHDAAIVYGPKGTYVLVIMTKGYSYGYIANVARQIEEIMYS